MEKHFGNELGSLHFATRDCGWIAGSCPHVHLSTDPLGAAEGCLLVGLWNKRAQETLVLCAESHKDFGVAYGRRIMS